MKTRENRDKKMGAKASSNGNQSPRTFSNSSSSDVVSANNSGGFNFLRTIEVTNDSRQRARSMSSVPDTGPNGPSNHHHHHHHHHQAYSNSSQQPFSHDANAGSGAHYEISGANGEDGGNSDDNNPMLQGINALGLGRVYTAASLPSHIWSINGESPMCNDIRFLRLVTSKSVESECRILISDKFEPLPRFPVTRVKSGEWTAESRATP